jgi:hypothetical protein
MERKKFAMIGTLVRKQIFHARYPHVQKNFCNRRRPQLQRNPAVRESLPNIFDNLSQQLAETPLTRVLAGVKSATRSTLLAHKASEFGREFEWVSKKSRCGRVLSLESEAI